jgi:hypothetical protein
MLASFCLGNRGLGSNRTFTYLQGNFPTTDTNMPKASKPSDAQRKRTREKSSGSRKKAKAHRKPMETSLKTYDVDLIATTVED